MVVDLSGSAGLGLCLGPGGAVPERSGMAVRMPVDGGLAYGELAYGELAYGEANGCVG